jgi:ribonuclease HI
MLTAAAETEFASNNARRREARVRGSLRKISSGGKGRRMLELYCDGSYRVMKDGRASGGWAARVVDLEQGLRSDFSGTVPSQDAAQAERYAVLLALMRIPDQREIRVYTDQSALIEHCGPPVSNRKNAHLWRLVAKEVARFEKVHWLPCNDRTCLHFRFCHLLASHEAILQERWLQRPAGSHESLMTAPLAEIRRRGLWFKSSGATGTGEALDQT